MSRVLSGGMGCSYQIGLAFTAKGVRKNSPEICMGDLDVASIGAVKKLA